MNPPLTQLDLHPLRAELYNELHSRPFHVLPCPAQVTHIALITTPEQRADQFRHWQDLHIMLGQPEPREDVSCYEATFGSLRIRREMHMEFASYTFINLGIGDDHQPFQDTGISSLPKGWLEKLTGTVVAAFHIDLQQASNGPETDLAQIRHWFEGERLVGSSPWEGKARVWGTFRLHSDGFGRFMVLNRDMSDSQLGRLTQRLMEIETYRLMSLLSLPLAREMTPSLNDMDQQLAVITQSLADNQDIDEREVLADLTNIAARIEAFRAHATFRFSATRAYHQLVLTRLEELREDELSGHLTITEFMTRRLTPAVETCESVKERLEDLSRRVDRASDMVRTRVELAIQSQNQQLLSSMDRRSKIQLMMQHTVEGFSVVVISYYLLALLKLALESADDAGFDVNTSLVLGIAIPVVLGLVFIGVRMIHHRFIRLARRQ
ncbi:MULTISPECIES: DUF3422 domain-containing protein [Marinobacter]|uniref:Egg lysin n=6 Tax=Marinobacter TaxID=2742 RepID=A0A1W6K588_9GAMM|nr:MULTISPECIES: DUF3422 domain-containing protein [Marinobacter]ARM82588.1 hypothetical protein MARSALSMR5_00487 [Marinobacter salarius]AZR41430.1 hypothetical protein MTMN5_01980 [Marinobacter salarius]MBL83185.1 DUF3422 domain-containing protein [Marinobacter sp.]MBS8230758.1 DUF3422 domain-containing protein [Marinobacter salarius]MCC4283338.1 DUF3422 domain-containing protein [Marinobacter salarius]